ncbi:MAG: DNA mismatch repair protein MutS [Vicinamibacterales bacterium]
MASQAPQKVYQQRQAHWSGEIARHERRHLLVSNLRLALVGLVALLLWFALSPRSISLGWTLVPLAAFAALVVVHARVLNERDRSERAKAYFDRGQSRLDETWRGNGADGARFIGDHPYARDLDLFGEASLFQLLNTTRTEAGEETLARWLKEPAAVDTIAARQGAVAELRGHLEFREAMAIFAAETRLSRTGSLAAWAGIAPAGLTALHGGLFAVAGVWSALTAVATWYEWIPLSVAVIAFGLSGAVAYAWRQSVHQALRGVDAAADDLGLLAGLLARVEGATFTAPRLRTLHSVLVTDGLPPSKQIARLQWYLAARDSVRNEFVRPFAMLLQVRGQSAVAIDRWHAAHRADLGRWLDTVGELEALCALATFAFEHPDDPFPVVDDGAPHLSAAGLAHPLLPAATAVANDVRLGGDAPHLLIVSGSNMSGKSTLLRSIGINAVLAFAGAPVRARSLSLSRLTPGATLRVQDSLDEGQSRFYAEILRIRDIVSTARNTPTLFLLDEILHGTNSHDRRIGAEAIVMSLLEAGAIGIVTTHDLALTALADRLGARARNVHFEDTLENGTLTFDYQMRDGVVTRSNAIELMRAVGISV